MARRTLLAGNWKMHGCKSDLSYFARVESHAQACPSLDIVVAPPFTLIASAAAQTERVAIAGQDCHVAGSGAHTGDVSADMLVDAGARYVIVGHSERRADHNEDDALIRSKARAAQQAGLVPIICVGEAHEDRVSGREKDVVGQQLKASLPDEGPYIVAYEPVWAIGTGLTASVDDIEDMHRHIRSLLVDGETVRILYGGSVKPSNSGEILELEDVDGALIGGASLKADDFIAIMETAPSR